MAREAVITYEQVASIADAMKSAGSKPMARSVREKLGNIGSMGTVNRFLQEWKAGQERKIDTALVLPEALQSAILNFMERELVSAKSVLEANLAELRQEVNDLNTENERQAADIEQNETTITSFHEELATLKGRLSQITSELVTSREEADRQRMATETARIELAKSLLRLEAMPRLELDLNTMRVELNTERQGRIEAEQKAAVLAARLDAATDRASIAESTLADFRGKQA